ncbi:MAG: hypothetical protein WDN28_28965 [Chthoniobacter sp.]
MGKRRMSIKAQTTVICQSRRQQGKQRNGLFIFFWTLWAGLVSLAAHARRNRIRSAGSCSANGRSPALSELEIEAIDLFISLIRLLGMPKSVGELYGLLFVSPVALPMDTLMERLNMSKGSASQA